jgi:hypothetical protein
MKKTIFSKIMLVMISCMFLTVFASTALGQTDSLRVWENIADGTLTSDWWESTSADYWKGQNESGEWSYNFTDDALGWANNYTYKASRWFQTFEVLDTSDAEAGVGVGQIIDDSRFYAVIYYLSFNGTTPECYVMYYNTTEIYYLDDGVGWDTNINNATDYSGDCEVDYLTGGQARIKAFWNWNIDDGTSNCSVRFKIWSPAGDEPQYWMVDTNFTYNDLDPFGGITNEYYPGIVADHSWDLDPTTTLFRRIYFWDLAYDRYISPTVPYISCPQYSIGDFIAWQETVDDVDYWNYTQAFKTMINEWDLTSYFDFNSPSKTNAQNDTIYIFTVMFTGILDYWEEWTGEEWTYDMVFPNNILINYIYVPIDGTSDSPDDYCRLRFDFDLDGYDATDFTSIITGDDWYHYTGWTNMTGDETEFYGSSGQIDVEDDSEWGTLFRDHEYAGYVSMLNWDLISDNLDAGNVVNLSISFYDNASSEYCVWQDWDKTTDLPDGSPSDNDTWMETAWNTTTYWGLLGISGDPLDFDDPVEDSIGEQTTTYLSSYVIPVIFAALLLIFILTLITTGNLTVETLITVLIIALLGIVTLVMLAGL